MSGEEESKVQEKSGGKGVKILGALIICILGGAGYAYSSGMVSLNMGSGEDESAEKSEPAVVLNEEPTFLPLEKFVVGLSQNNSRSFMVVELSLVSHDPRLEEQVEKLDSILRNAFLKHFAGKGIALAREEVANPSKLQAELRQKFVNAAESYGQELALEEVLLTNVLIQ